MIFPEQKNNVGTLNVKKSKNYTDVLLNESKYKKYQDDEAFVYKHGWKLVRLYIEVIVQFKNCDHVRANSPFQNNRGEEKRENNARMIYSSQNDYDENITKATAYALNPKNFISIHYLSIGSNSCNQQVLLRIKKSV